MTYKPWIIGFAIGDSMGVPVEFHPRKELKQNPVISMRGYGTHKKPAGTWSDDTTMTVATMESIGRLGVIDYTDIMTNFAKWFIKDEFTVDGRFDTGNTTRHAIVRFIKGTPPLYCGDSQEHQNGNGSLMRMMPIALYCHSRYGNRFSEEAMDIIHDMSALTHAHPISLMCCGFYCLIIAELLEGLDIPSAISEGLKKGSRYYMSKPIFPQYITTVFSKLLDRNFINLSEDDIESSGYVLHSLEVALWCLLNTKDYKSLILKAINLGGDTDTNGAITAGIGSTVYSVSDLPKQWISSVRNQDYLLEIENQFNSRLG